MFKGSGHYAGKMLGMGGDGSEYDDTGSFADNLLTVDWGGTTPMV